ncbi:GntR family transcriptional regulator [Olsenella sp. HMSC062G07]|uniref:GntR family transcriptional regulator n=1 Tax=Olsenella sp. HMSC062G07 TaxID=1739330 RepID=UPI0008A63C5D|nr:GntR family transcriptional regulator [Olsenella sp. HMSC062G07]OFK23255.1 GntR family transcriptional regulator [Olsenella sp. HMSC062G07]
MNLIISNASDQPIYEQVASQLRDAILAGELSEGELLPSIRSLANSLRISVITTKRAYAELERQGFIDTVQGKGSFVARGNRELLFEGRRRQVERLLSQALDQALSAGIDPAELHQMLDLLADASREGI